MNDEVRVVIVDINMPVMSGWDFLNEFAKFDPTHKLAVTIYIVSSSVDPADHRRAKDHPDVADIIVKPLTRDVVRRLLAA